MGYAEREYWNKRFTTQDKDFDWYCTWEELKIYFVKHGLVSVVPASPKKADGVSPNAESKDSSSTNDDDSSGKGVKSEDCSSKIETRNVFKSSSSGSMIPTTQLKVLVVGCGSSNLSDEMYRLGGFHDITNIDISDVVVEAMRQKQPHMEWLQMDATEMMFRDDTFDLVIDKGTVDALVCDANVEVCQKMLAEIHRVCRGKFILLSYNRQRDSLVFESVRKFGSNATPADKDQDKLEASLDGPSKSDGFTTIEACKCELSPEASLINFIRALIPRGVPLSEALKIPVVAAAVGSVYRKEMCQRMMRQKILEFKVLKKGMRKFSLEGSIYNPGPYEEDTKQSENMEENHASAAVQASATESFDKETGAVEKDTEATYKAETTQGADERVADAGDESKDGAAEPNNADDPEKGTTATRKQQYIWLYVMEKVY